MIDIRLIRDNPDLVRENIRKKFQDAKLPLVDEVIELDKANRAAINEASNLRAERNSLSKKIGMLLGQAKKDPSKLGGRGRQGACHCAGRASGRARKAGGRARGENSQDHAHHPADHRPQRAARPGR